MSIFIYEAVDEDGGVVNSEINAVDSEEAVALLTQKRLIPIKIISKSGPGSRVQLLPFSSRNLFENFSSQDKIILIRNLAATVKSGLSLNEALEILISDSNKKVVKKFLLEAQNSIQNGQPLSRTFEANSRYFSPLFIGMIKAGEASGHLGEALEELSHYLLREYKLVKKVKSALAYPLILMTTSIGIVILMLVFVLPRLSKTFTQNNIKLPFLTQVLVSLSNLITYNFWFDFLFVAALVGIVVYFKKNAQGKKVIAYLTFKIPVVRSLVKKIILVRFSRTLGGLVDSSLSISESLNLSARSLGNSRYEKVLNGVDEDLKNGIPLSKSLRKNEDLFPKILISLIGVGEKTGSLGKVLKSFAEFYEDDVDSALKDLTTFLEPALLLFMGLTVGIIALAILLPVYSMVGSFKY
jgi:type II secretory pathway component PulF